MIEQNLALYKDFEQHDKGVDQAKAMVNGGIVTLAYHLKFIKEQKLYKAQGDDGQMNWTSYCASKGVNKNTADKYITLYNFYVLEMGKPVEVIASMSSDTLQKYQPVLKKLTPPEREEMFEKMQSPLSLSDIRKEFEEKKLIEPAAFKIDKCEKCGKITIQYDQDKICMCIGSAGVYALPILK